MPRGFSAALLDFTSDHFPAGAFAGRSAAIGSRRAAPRIWRCSGYRPPELTSMMRQYPWARHDPALAEDIPWEVTSCNGGALFSLRCNKEVATAGAGCSECTALRSSPKLQKIVANAIDPEYAGKTANDVYASHAAMVERRDSCRLRYNQTWLEAQNAMRKVQTLSKAVSLHKRLITVLSTNDVPKLRQVLAVGLRNGCSMSRLIERLSDAIAGAYRPRGGATELDYDLVTLIMRLGGGKLLFALAKPLGLPSESAWRDAHFHTISQLVACAGMKHLKPTITHNLRELYPEEYRVASKRPWAILMDEIALDSAVTYCSTNNVSLGCCYEHTTENDMVVTDADALRSIKTAIDNGEIHANVGDRQAKEALVVSVAPFANQRYQAKAVVMMATCKSNIAGQQQSIIDLVEECWDELCADRLGPIETAYSDGDAPRRQDFTASETEALGGKAGDILGQLPLFDLKVTRKGRSRAFDMKHCGKRLRAVFKSITRGTTAGSVGCVPVKAATTGEILKDSGGIDPIVVARMLTPKVRCALRPLAVRLIERIHATDTHHSRTPGTADTRTPVMPCDTG